MNRGFLDEKLTRVVLTREDAFEEFLANVRNARDDDVLERLFDWRNPSQMRPASMLRNRE